MITIENINGAPNGNIPQPNFGSHCDSENFYFFQSQVEADEFRSELIDQLAILKAGRLQEIDSRTRELIEAGFTFGGKLFSLSDNAQRNWIGIQSALSGGLLTEVNFPFELSAKDDTIYLLEWSNRFLFMGAVLQGIAIPKTSGSILKQQVHDCETIEEVNAIIDLR